jgi:hypothetical protein
LWRSVTAGLPDDWELDERELAVLTLAARQADDVAALERALKRDGVTVAGSAGQLRVNPLVPEVRQARLATGRLLGQLSLPDEQAQPRTDAGRRGQKAAQARWAREADKRERRRGAA